MPATPPPRPLVKRLSPGAWAAIAWSAGLAVTVLTRMRLPGESGPRFRPGIQLFRWDGPAFLLVATALTLAGCALLPRRPLSALCLMLLATICATFPLSEVEIPMAQFVAVDVALYAVAAARPRRTALPALALAVGTLVGFLAFRWLMGWPVGMSAELAVALVAVVAWLLGRSAHQAQEYAERARAQVERQAVTAERLRIAREMHDLVAHTIGVVALQAGAAARIVESRPDRAREAMLAVETAGREALSGLRRMVGALREGEPSTDELELTPAATLAGLDRLAAATTAAGVRVDVRWDGERRALPPELELSAFRIAQESVTNVVRHSGAASCEVRVAFGEAYVSVTVTDEGDGSPRAASGGPGLGLAGMRERVALLHGEFAAGPRPEGGWRVSARLPVPAYEEAR
ncbi:MULTISPECIES: sensor histidine kinase [Streptomyces]|uniref:histidine kinase n=1 Tax=Streptomyces solicathayae TaxID=3081768 RepID=A0ABZ0LW19_9ACTN|nr:sensor histidine kinase [Streptomyces sp. HUAS YS2]WOX23647.1 sensor histidine kinase [Streptomyces sp. HUAS YS2]